MPEGRRERTEEMFKQWRMADTSTQIQGGRWGGRQSADDFSGSGDAVCDTTLRVRAIIHVSKPQNTTARVPPKVNWGLQAAATCQRRFVVGKPRTVLTSEADCGGGSLCVCVSGGRSGGIWDISVFISQFHCKPKLLFKNNLKKKKKISENTNQHKYQNQTNKLKNLKQTRNHMLAYSPKTDRK